MTTNKHEVCIHPVVATPVFVNGEQVDTKYSIVLVDRAGDKAISRTIELDPCVASYIRDLQTGIAYSHLYDSDITVQSSDDLKQVLFSILCIILGTVSGCLIALLLYGQL
jgi:hypothetical protein